MGSGASSRFLRAAASPALLGRGNCGLVALVTGLCRSRSLVEWRRGFCGVCWGVPKMACLKARTANTGAGVSGASTNALVSWSVAFVSQCDSSA
jgi:hypothetical protein